MVQKWRQAKRFSDYIFVVDPLGNTMLRLPAVFDVADSAKARRDLERLLKRFGVLGRSGAARMTVPAAYDLWHRLLQPAAAGCGPVAAVPLDLRCGGASAQDSAAGDAPAGAWCC